MLSIYFETFGCAANQNNTEIMKGLVRQAGLEITNNIEIADIFVVNSCVVKEPTEKKVENRVFQLLKKKKPVILAGCMPEVRKFREKNLYLLGIHNIREIVKLIKAISESKRTREIIDRKDEVKLNLPKIPQNKLISITQISEGCVGDCSFCITKLAKGNLFSYPESEIIKNIENDLKAGAKEIWLTSQDNAAYGLDRGERKIIELLRKIISLKGRFKIRLGMMNPNNVLPVLNEMIEIYKDEKIYKFLHLPLQSGSNKILKLMKRKYSVKDFLKIIKKFRKNIPNITIATDIIVGFPYETEKDFQQTLKILREIKPDIFNANKYWARKGTEAFLMKQIDAKIRIERAIKIMKEYKKHAREKLKNFVGKKMMVFVNEKKNAFLLARTDNYKIVQVLSLDKSLLGKNVEVKILVVERNHLLGEVDETD